MSDLENIINQAFERRADISPSSVDADTKKAVEQAIELIDNGKERVAEQRGVGDWKVNEWLKKAVLLSFRIRDNEPMPAGGFTQFYDKVDTKFTSYSAQQFADSGVRVVPPAVARKGSFIASDTVLMPSYAGGVGIGGVLEPLQASPTIIEDNCFIGARSEVVEGVIVEEGAVISMGVYIGQSTRIYDREKDEVIYGRVPAGSVVVSGNLPAENGKYSLYCAVIVKTVDEKTRSKVGINELLRTVD